MIEKGPDNPSSDYEAMLPYWQMSDALIGGAQAMRKGGQTYLPKFPNESDADYKLRLSNAKFTNIFGDILETLASKPFEQELMVENAGATEPYLEDIDGDKNHIHVFAGTVFHSAIADAITWILVDYTKGVPPGATVAQERALGARPYWVHIKASDLLAIYTKKIGGVETIVHARIREDVKEQDGYEEVSKERVRVLNREVIYNDSGDAVSASDATWELFEKQKDTTTGKENWVSLGGGVYTIGEIPLVPVITGRRKGKGWQFKPALLDAANLQVKHYQYESGLDYAADLTCFPMLAGNGVSPSKGEDGAVQPVPVGPKAVLYAPPNGEGDHGQWEFIEPGAQSLTFISEKMIKATEEQIRELGRQPLTAQSGNITTITAAFAGDKAHTVIEAWALNLKDALENCLKLTAKWLRQDLEPEVQINTDFSLAMKEDTGMSSLMRPELGVICLRRHGGLKRSDAERYHRISIQSRNANGLLKKCRATLIMRKTC